MELGSPSVSGLPLAEDPQACSECHSVSRLTNGLCLNCLLRGALNEQNAEVGKDAFKEVLSGVKSRDGDWHIADHEIIYEIARGGMGVVYQAREPHSDRIVALKCVLAYQGGSDEIVTRFRREAETAARLDHPNIVPLYRIGETADGFPYYTMKYAPGGSLLQARAPLRQHPRQSVELMLKVARAVHYAHENGVLHRDLKPGNILLDQRGEPLVSDFGLARSEAASGYLTRSLSSFGTPGYIAPEQADGPTANLTPAADVYSLGAILFELLTGQTPFTGENAFAVMKQSAEEPAPKARSLAPHVDRDLERICERCLERDPANRYQTAAELADDLQRWLAGDPISTRRMGPWRRAKYWGSQHRKLAATISILIAVAAAVAVGWQVQSHRNAVLMRERTLAARSMLVLPFLDLDRAAPDPGFARAIANSLQRRIEAKGPARIEVADLGSVLNWSASQVIHVGGKPAKARALVTGTVRTIESKKRISLRLLNGVTGDAVFAKIWEVPLTAEAEVNDDLAQRIEAVLNTTDWSSLAMPRNDPGYRNPAAKEAILAGRDLLSHGATASECDKAIALAEGALKIEPESALAHVLLANAAIGRTHYKGDLSFLVLGEAEADKALALAPESTEAHRAKAAVYYQQGKFRQALEEQLRTIEVGGVEEKTLNFIAGTVATLGHPDEALAWCRVPVSGAPILGEVYCVIGDNWTNLTDDDRALKAYRRAVELTPNLPDPYIGVSRFHLLQHDFRGARECLAKAPNNRDVGELDQLAAQIEFFARDYRRAEQLYEELFKKDPEGGGPFWGAVTYRSALARIKQEIGPAEEGQRLAAECFERAASRAARETENPEVLYRLAAVEALSSKTEPALQHLEEAFRFGWIDYRSLQLDPRFDSLRSLPEFEQILKTISNTVGVMREKAQQQAN